MRLVSARSRVQLSTVAILMPAGTVNGARQPYAPVGPVIGACQAVPRGRQPHARGHCVGARQTATVTNIVIYEKR